MNACVDLRSDTVTRPTPAMYEAMQRAPVGDDTYGEDPTVNALQARIAGMLGFEAAMFVSSGTQANLCAVLAQCGRGDEYIVGQMAHCYRWEAGGAAMFGGVQPQPLDHAEDGTLPLAAIADAIKPDNEHFAVTRLLALENTLGGRCLPDAYLGAATGLARQHGLSTHLDGARLFNAATASAATSPEAGARRIAGHFDSVSVCFSKGLGAPVGSALCGSAAFIARARRVRKAAGGAMRQAGVLAAAALHALDHHVERLAEDHRLARLLYEGICDSPGVRAEVPQTNIVFLDLADRGQDTAHALQQHLQEKGILVSMLYGRLRFVIHRDVQEGAVLRVIDAIRRSLDR
ncbi:threonine aldolase [Variovorax boronicumulans]|uniref:low-specificity L-threonine aldolase n=1 Tax=Variovorax boronicumulans TaxID=436515 RepID=UPI003399BDC6